MAKTPALSPLVATNRSRMAISLTTGFFAGALALAVGGWTAQAVAQGGGLVPETLAVRHGLTRSWYAQMSLNRANEKVIDVTLNGGVLFVQTSGAMIHALDAETGRALWVELVGRSDRTTVAPGANAKNVAIINGSMLYLLDRQSGKIEWSRKLRGSAGAGPVLTKENVIVPLVDGMLEGYHLAKREHDSPWIYQSVGRVYGQPVMTPEVMGWTTDRGYFYVASNDPMKIRARLQTRGSIEGRPGYWTPYFYAASLDGYVYAIHGRTAETAWKFAVADPMTEPPIAINGRVYVVREGGGMYCLDGEKGTQLWFAPNVGQFVSMSPTRIYTIDRSQRMLILDAETGGRLDLMPVEPSLKKMRNEQTDRIYLIGSNGLIQCLREIEQPKPVVYTPPELPEVETALSRQKKKEKPKGEGEDAGGEKKAGGDEPAEGGDKMMDDAKPGDKPAKAEEDPFK